MQRNKDKQRDTIILEAIVWALILGIAYIFAKAFSIWIN